MSNIGPLFVSVIAGIIGLAITAVLVSQKAQTSQVIGASGSALGTIIGAAVAPVTGTSPNLAGGFGSNAIGSLGTPGIGG